MVQPPGMPPSGGVPKPSGPPLPVLLYALCLVPITAFAGWAITYGQDEEALEQKLRSKYGNEINSVESKRQNMSEVYMAAIKNPGQDPETERRLQQVLRGGKGEVKRHFAVDEKYYGTEEGLKLQKQNAEEMQQHQDDERKRMKKVKKKLKKKKKKKKQEGEGDEEGEASSASSETESESEDTTISTRKKKAAAAGAAFAAAVASAKVNKSKADGSNAAESKEQKKRKKKKKKDSPMDSSQIATLAAVAGVAAMVGFLVGGGSRRQ